MSIKTDDIIHLKMYNTSFADKLDRLIAVLCIGHKFFKQIGGFQHYARGIDTGMDNDILTF